MNRTTYISLNVLAKRLGLPAAWLKAEANGGRIPHLSAGRRLLFDFDQVREAIDARMRASATEAKEGVDKLTRSSHESAPSSPEDHPDTRLGGD